jgi:catechol 2,3-dioxygenase-like lactoylglutathione lyase family enzyme
MLSDSPCRPTIAVSDKEMARAFYGDTLGLPLHEENPVGATFRCGGGTFLEVYPSQFAGSVRSTSAGFEVADLAAEMTVLRERGVVFEDYDLPLLKTADGVAQLGPNRVAWFKDPDGNTFALVERG